MVEKSRMYAHVYFNIPANSLGIAVYARGKIPGFSGALDPELQEHTDSRKAFKLFLKTLGDDEISADELQQGRIFQYNRLESKLNTLDILGKLIAKDKEAQVTINLDDPLTWLDLKLKNLSEEKQYVVNNFPDAKKRQLGEELRQEGLQSLLTVEDSAGLKDELQKIYTSVSRSLYPESGVKDYPGTKKYPSATPPTFLVSQEYDFAYYPGFKGAHHMTVLPKSDRFVHPEGKDTPSELKWMQDIIPNTMDYLSQPLSSFDEVQLDNITEALAKSFYSNLDGTDFANFQRAASAIKNRANILLLQLVEHSDLKTASSKIGTWIDLADGRIFDNEAALIASEQEEQEEMAKAAETKLRKVARSFLKNRNFKAFKKLMERVR